MTDQELTEIEARAHVATRGTSPWYDDAVMRSTSDVPALVAEIRRLRDGLHRVQQTCKYGCNPRNFVCPLCVAAFGALAGTGAAQ